jgi:hypothetical protein
LQPIDPASVLLEIAKAVPSDCRQHIIVIGSLAVGYHYRDQLAHMAVRTKDADCLLSPRVQAIPSGVAIANQLLDADWTFRATHDHPAPGGAETPEAELPAVRLSPPGRTEWFIELLTVPESPEDRTRRWTRIRTRHGDFALHEDFGDRLPLYFIAETRHPASDRNMLSFNHCASDFGFLRRSIGAAVRRHAAVLDPAIHVAERVPHFFPFAGLHSSLYVRLWHSRIPHLGV